MAGAKIGEFYLSSKLGDFAPLREILRELVSASLRWLALPFVLNNHTD